MSGTKSSREFLDGRGVFLPRPDTAWGPIALTTTTVYVQAPAHPIPFTYFNNYFHIT